MYRYFSFFGSVKLANGADLDRALAQTDYDMTEAVRKLAAGKELVLEQYDNSTSAHAWKLSPRCALLVVENQMADWIEADVVVWPLKFECPAAIAAADVCPRYGLE